MRVSGGSGYDATELKQEELCHPLGHSDVDRRSIDSLIIQLQLPITTSSRMLQGESRISRDHQTVAVVAILAQRSICDAVGRELHSVQRRWLA